MGALHDGHISLIRTSNRVCDLTICSIYVNPTQFNNPEDLEKYPRTIKTLVLVPTRELAAQIGDSFHAYGEFHILSLVPKAEYPYISQSGADYQALASQSGAVTLIQSAVYETRAELMNQPSTTRNRWK